MTLSTHQVPVVKIKLEPHPNGDNLSIVTVFGMNKVVVNKEGWKDGDLAAYIQPDSLVDVTRPEFSFLDRRKTDAQKTTESCFERIKTRRFRQVWSHGLLVPAPPGAVEEEDVAEKLGVKHYSPEEHHSGAYGSFCIGPHNTRSEPVPPPLSTLSKYDVDSLRNYPSVLQSTDAVVCTEKIHGSNARYAYIKTFNAEGAETGRFYAGSRSRWCYEDANDPWWKALHNTPELKLWLEEHPNFIVYAELYGVVKGMKYGCKDGVQKLAVFDIYNPCFNNFVSHSVARLIAPTLPWVPVLYEGPYSFEAVEKVTSGSTVLGNGEHIREGCVVKPLTEALDRRGNRVCYKLVSDEYLSR